MNEKERVKGEREKHRCGGMVKVRREGERNVVMKRELVKGDERGEEGVKYGKGGERQIWGQ